jgi:L,D-peptidoglycan transpeptidase YkuD (ErfK/YbiS/YcfS/YnhG family)
MKFFLVMVFIFSGRMMMVPKNPSYFGTTGPRKDSLKSGQLVVVVTDNWNSIRARLYCFEKMKDKWTIQYSFPAVVGKNGLAPGEGVYPLEILGASYKKEGDMKAPAGIFYLGPAFGYIEKSAVKWIQIPYLQATDDLICVDDSNSRNYNHLIKKSSGNADWKSHEEMHLHSEEYKWGIFVQYNFKPVQTGKGSCIFLHVWESEGEGTAGCTAMEEKNILKLMHWLRSVKDPVLIQLPETEYRKLSPRYNLPGL